jgi:carbamoyl-phosphate synthase large subunit
MRSGPPNRRTIGYPVLVRPSFVLGGRAMEIVLRRRPAGPKYMTKRSTCSPDHPVLIDKFLEDAIEVDVDAISDGETTLVGGVMEHIEEAGIHSRRLGLCHAAVLASAGIIEEIKQATYGLAKALKCAGLMNIQFAVKMDGDVCRSTLNPIRGQPSYGLCPRSEPPGVAYLAVRLQGDRSATGPHGRQVMAGVTLKQQGVTQEVWPHYTSVKESVFPFNRFQGVDIILGPEMKSTGEVMASPTTSRLVCQEPDCSWDQHPVNWQRLHQHGPRAQAADHRAMPAN